MDDGLYGPRSLTWRISRERAMLLGGPRALLMQLAHPLVAAGVAAHSTFQKDPVARLRRTLDVTLALVFGTSAEAEAAVAAINGVHARVRGTLPQSVGHFPAGTPYDARDPELLLWVHATLVDTSLLVYPEFVAPLSPNELRDAYEESKAAARALLVPDDLVPPTLEAFRDYVARMIASGAIAVGDLQRELGAQVLYPRIRFLPRPAMGFGAAITVGLLPPEVRAAYGLELTPARRRIFEQSRRLVRRLLPVLPGAVRYMPQARKAYRRVGA